MRSPGIWRASTKKYDLAVLFVVAIIVGRTPWRDTSCTPTNEETYHRVLTSKLNPLEKSGLGVCLWTRDGRRSVGKDLYTGDYRVIGSSNWTTHNRLSLTRIIIHVTMWFVSVVFVVVDDDDDGVCRRERDGHQVSVCWLTGQMFALW